MIRWTLSVEIQLVAEVQHRHRRTVVAGALVRRLHDQRVAVVSQGRRTLRPQSRESRKGSASLSVVFSATRTFPYIDDLSAEHISRGIDVNNNAS